MSPTLATESPGPTTTSSDGDGSAVVVVGDRAAEGGDDGDGDDGEDDDDDDEDDVSEDERADDPQREDDDEERPLAGEEKEGASDPESDDEENVAIDVELDEASVTMSEKNDADYADDDDGDDDDDDDGDDDDDDDDGVDDSANDATAAAADAAADGLLSRTIDVPTIPSPSEGPSDPAGEDKMDVDGAPEEESSAAAARGKKNDVGDDSAKDAAAVAAAGKGTYPAPVDEKDKKTGGGRRNAPKAGGGGGDGGTGNRAEGKPLPPPSWPDVTFDQLVKYPKIALRAQSYFDMQQIRAIKPVTLTAMGIAVPKFPNLEEEEVIKLAVQKGSKNHVQLYHPADVLTLKKKAKPTMQKEMLRRAILHNLRDLGEDATHNDIPKVNLQRNKQGMRQGVPTHLPKPGSYSNAQCLDWLRNNPPAKEEHDFILQNVRQWMRQVRDQIGRINPRTPEIELALTEFDVAREMEEEEEEGEKSAAARGAAAASAASAPAGASPVAAAGVYQNYANVFGAAASAASAAPQVMSLSARKTGPPNNGAADGGSYHEQLAASVNLNNMQAQAIYQYQNQLAALHSRLEGATNRTVFEISVAKDTFKFNASHFVAFPGFRERLHGHSYRASVKVMGSHEIGGDGYVLDFGCVKSVAKEACKELNEYFLVPMLSDVLQITVDGSDDDGIKNPSGETPRKRGRPRSRAHPALPDSVRIHCEDGSTFIFPKGDCLLLPIVHSTAEELAVYLYGKILQGLDAGYLLQRGVTAMEVTVSEAVGQDAVFRHPIQAADKNDFDVAAYVSKKTIPVMPCATETEAARQRKIS